MNQVTRSQGNAVANPNSNYFEAYAEQANRRTIVGKLLKFSKGDWLAGEHNTEVPSGTKFIANMDELLIGWTRWAEGRPTDQIMGRVAEGYAPPRRNDLGDDDKSDWEVDNQGQPRDPWQFGNVLLLQDASGDLYTFTTSSRGGLNAIGELCREFGRQMRQKPDEFPVIEIGTDSYMHPNKSLGRIKVPTLKVTGWKPKSAFVSEEATTEEANDPAAEENARGKKAAAGATRF